MCVLFFVAEACVCLLMALARRRFPVVVAACVFPLTEKLILTLFAKNSLELQGRKRCPGLWTPVELDAR